MVFRRLVKDSAIYGSADFLSKIIGFFTFPVIAAALSPKAFGVLELIATTTALLGLVTNCGLNNAVQRFYWDKETEVGHRPFIVSSGLVAQMIFAVAGVLLGLVAIPFILPTLQAQHLPLSWIALVAALLLMAFSQWSQYALDVIRLHHYPWAFTAISTASRVGSAIMGVWVVVFMSWGIDGLLGVQALVILAVLPWALYFIRRDLTVRLDRRWLKELVCFGYPFIFAGLAYWLFGSMDRWMLAAMSSVEEVGIYSVAFRFASVILFVSAAFGQAWSPVAIKIQTDHPTEYRNLYARVLLLLLFVMLTVGGGVALFSGELIALIMPAEYASSALPLAILCFGIVLQATQQVTAVGISIEKKTFLFARLAWGTAAVNLVLNWILIPEYGGIGAAWATFISYVVLTGSYLFFTQRLHPLVIEWMKLGTLLSLGGLVLILSVLFNETELSPKVLTTKVLIAVGCLWLGWRMLPLRGLQIGP